CSAATLAARFLVTGVTNTPKATTAASPIVASAAPDGRHDTNGIASLGRRGTPGARSEPGAAPADHACAWAVTPRRLSATARHVSHAARCASMSVRDIAVTSPSRYA